MSDATAAYLPPYFEVPHDDDPVPPEVMLGGPRIRCTLDGTRLWSIEDAHLHDDHFHAKTDSADGRPEPDLGYLRHDALDQTTRVATGRSTTDQLVQRAQAFEAFLRGDDPSEQRTYPFVDGPHLVLGPECFTGDGEEVPQTVISWRGENFYSNRTLAGDTGDLDVLERLLGFIRERTFEDASGLRSLQGQDVQDEAASFLVDSNFEQLRMMAHVVAAVRALVVAELNRRNP